MSDVTPNDMPGAAEAPTADAEGTDTQVVEAPETPEKGLPPEKLADLNRTLRNEKKAAERKAREAEQRAAANDGAAKKLTELLQALGVEGKPGEFDAKAEIIKINEKLETSERERLRADIARTEKVDPEFIHGATEDDMRASAQRYRQAIETAIEEALKAKNVPAAPPASTVTANGKIAGPEQITSREELAKLSPEARAKAYEDGRLDALMGKQTT